MKTPIPPIFVAEGLDITVHASIEDAQLELEPWWVEQNEGSVYDSEGNLLKLEISKRRVFILPGEENAGHAKELESLLRRFLKAIGEPTGDDSTCDLRCLVNFCHKFIK